MFSFLFDVMDEAIFARQYLASHICFPTDSIGDLQYVCKTIMSVKWSIPVMMMSVKVCSCDDDVCEVVHIPVGKTQWVTVIACVDHE